MPNHTFRLFVPAAEDLLYYCFVGIVVGVAFVIHRTSGIPRELNLLFYKDWLFTYALVYACLRVVAECCHAKLFLQQSILDGDLWRRIGIRVFGLPRLLNFLGLLLTMSVLLTIFTAFKASIPDIVPFSWDGHFLAWDRWLHFGQDPWKLLQPLSGIPFVTWLLDKAYGLWFPVVWAGFIIIGWHTDQQAVYRSQYLLAMAACWILLGNVAATALSSVGPIFFSLVVDDPNPYSSLVEHILRTDAETPFRLRTVWEYAFLWHHHNDPAIVPGEGISAMPSLHISMVVLLALVGSKINKFLGYSLAAFGIVIFVASISLAWHYAVDGYVAAIGTVAIWWLSGIAVAKWKESRFLQYVRERS